MIRLILLLLLVGLILAIRYLPWWALLGGPVVLVILFWLLRGRIFMWFLSWLFFQPFKAKGRVLRKASIEIHSLKRVAEPALPQLSAPKLYADDEAGEIPRQDAPPAPVERDYYELEVTIIPRSPTGAFKLWEPGELLLVRPGKKWDEDDNSCAIVSLDIDHDGIFTADEGMKHFGPRRLRLLIGVKRGTRQLAFAYYFEQFGEVNLAGADR